MLINLNNIKPPIQHYFIPSTNGMPSRRYDLDWLRVLVFGLLIFYHTGMVYVANWGFHFKSQYQFQGLELVMLTIEPWRMAVLWIISGIAIKFLLAKVSLLPFILKRSLRLLLPLLFGILVIVPPQLYVEMSQKSGLDISYLHFLFEFYTPSSPLFEHYQSGIWPHIDVNHLWYLRSLWQYSIFMIALLPILNSNVVVKAINWILNLHGILAVSIAVMPLFLLQIFWDSDTVRYPLGFTFMLYGYLLAWSPQFWQKLTTHLTSLIVVTIAVLTIFLCLYQWVWLEEGSNTAPETLLFGTLIYSMARILGVLTVLGLGYKYLNKSSNRLNYWSEGVYPFYILHQSIIIIAAYQLAQIDFGQYGALIEPLLVISITIIGCLICYEIIRKSSFLRPHFGLEQHLKYSQKVTRFGYIIASLVILPITLRLLP